MKNILISGGSGFFGRALVAKLLTMPVERIAIYSRGEHAQEAMRQQFGDSRLRWLIGDVRDEARLELAMHGVDTVIHAAALKRIDVCQRNPLEAVATNIFGTRNVVFAALKMGVQRVVYLSTDKAVCPSTLYGHTKACAERLVLDANNYGRTQFSAVRYGNVAGSTGSVIPVWRARKAQATITDPEATRYWMTKEDAVAIVLDAARTMPAQVLTVDLPGFRVSDLAAAMDMPAIRVVGLAPNEKLHERMTEDGPDSSQVRRMSVAELREALAHV